MINADVDPLVVNTMANYLFDKGNEEASLNYYSVLLEHDQLNDDSVENLAMYHLRHRYLDEALSFLEEAAGRQPQKVYLYIQYLKHCSDPGRLKAMRSKLLRQFAGAVRIPEFNRLFVS
ncbi:hypothetical protein [Paenibacillus sp. B01]|uniref:hypothetical protein n=1 Tax=Paenibacillus sp. B01 TaxID=2660554 RepID=UPI00129B4D79|nr:hypothetical protein [Paenibacillus sp. B01]QGG58082.1 hypothetical protein GE073_22575 [Paenibacillus sp. B01]